jgi:prevent-host-death family protein
MKFSQSIKPISYLKSHASELIRDISENQGTLVVTHNGEAKVVVQDIHSYERMQETLALLKRLAMSSKSIKEGKVKPVKQAFADIRKKIKERRK